MSDAKKLLKVVAGDYINNQVVGSLNLGIQAISQGQRFDLQACNDATRPLH